VRRPNATSLTHGRGYQTRPINSNPYVAGQMLRGAPRFLTRQRSRSWASVRRRECHARNGTGGVGGSQFFARDAHTPLRRLRRRTRSVRRTWARSWGAEGEKPTLHAGEQVHSHACVCSSSSVQLVHAGRRPPCVRRPAPCMHSRTALACVLWVGCSAEAGSPTPAGCTAPPPWSCRSVSPSQSHERHSQ
jgi:hypothetical protein